MTGCLCYEVIRYLKRSDLSILTTWVVEKLGSLVVSFRKALRKHRSNAAKTGIHKKSFPMNHIAPTA